MVMLRFSASKVAVVTGLHEFGDIVDEFLKCLYQDREELLVSDATRLHLHLVSKDDELELLVQKSGTAVAPQLLEALGWAKDRKLPANVEVVQKLLTRVDKRLKEAHESKQLACDEVHEVRKLLVEKIYTRVGTCNESLALEAYERQTGSKVRSTNEHFYFLTFPPATNGVEDAEKTLVDYLRLAEQCHRTTILKRQRRLESESTDLAVEDEEEERSIDGYFSICGMVDGITDALTISADDEWELMPVVVEVKNRMRGFQNPPPLADHIQLAVYMKLLGVEHGDLIECIYGVTSHPTIRVSRVSLGVAPLCLPQGRDVWTEVIVPRLYAFTAAVQKLLNDEQLRLAFLVGTDEERLAIVRAECDFL